MHQFGAVSAFPAQSKALPKWEDHFQDFYWKASQCVILLISPPGKHPEYIPLHIGGAGKTWLLTKEIIPHETSHFRKCERIDCSNDELVERALDSILHEKFSDEGTPSLLVADEYHMLSKEHKEELLLWVSTRLHWLKVVLIGNRSNGIHWLL